MTERTWEEIIDKQNKRDKQDEDVVNYFKGKLNKAVKQMKLLHEMDDDISDEEFYKVANKVKYWIGKEELEIELARKALKKREDEIYKLTRSMNHNSYDMWFYYVRELVMKEKGEEVL